MKRIAVLAFAVALIGFLPLAARGANTISITATSPLAGQVVASGAFTLDTGVTVSSVKLIVYPATGGGAGAEVTCMYDPMAKTWSGMAAGLPTGTYTAVARMVLNAPNPDTFSPPASQAVK